MQKLERALSLPFLMFYGVGMILGAGDSRFGGGNRGLEKNDCLTQSFQGPDGLLTEFSAIWPKMRVYVLG